MSKRGGGGSSSGGRGQRAPPRRGGGRGGGGRGRGAPLFHEEHPSLSVPAATATASSSLSEEFQRRLTIPETRSPSPAQASTSAPAPAELQLQHAPASSKAERFPPRPSLGTIGKKCVVRANHFLVEVAENKQICHYDVSITPEVSSRGVNRAIFKQLVETYKESHLGRRKPVYDGRKSVYSSGSLPFESKEFLVKLVDKDNTSTRREREFKVAIKFAARADLHHLLQFLRARQADAPQETIQALDVVLRESPSNNYITVQRSFFAPDMGVRSSIGDGLECWRGFYQSIRPTQMGLSLNIDISTTSFYEPIPVLDFVAQHLNLRDFSRPLSDHNRAKIKKVLWGVKVTAKHQEASRVYRITGITNQQLSQLTFPIDEQGSITSVIRYFRERYNVNLKYVALPCLQAGSDSKPTYLPMELCEINEGQRYNRKLNERQITAILRAACQRPHERENSIRQIVVRNNYQGDVNAKEFGIKVHDRLVSIEARVLPPPELMYHASGREANCRPNVGQWNMINKKMVNGGKVDYWMCLNFSGLNPRAAQNFCQELVGMCQNIGMTFSLNPVLPLRSEQPHRIEMTLADVHAQACSRFHQMGVRTSSIQLLIIILPDRSGSYGKIKRICETELGIVSQCCQPRQASRINKQYLENVALKINVKVGGRNTVLADALASRIPLVTDAPTIVFGADVTHPSPGEDSSPSIAAVVASMDWPEVTKYRGLISTQPHRQELINDLFQVVQDPQRGSISRGMIREHLIAFKKATGRKPHRIIFYRDGVSEGQFGQVLLYELDAIRKACASLEEGYLPPVTFVVVQKRHHTRLFPENSRDRDSTDRSGNILPGTVVDSKICHPIEFDFYLCSHAGIQGTSRPTHYHVLWDENKFKADQLQQLTNNLCYTYARCTRSVSVVPPAYYAHLAAFRARYYIESEATDSEATPPGGHMRERRAEVRPLPQIKDNVKEVMFYC